MFVAGLDVHLKYVTVAVLDSTGTIQREVEVSTRTPSRMPRRSARSRPPRKNMIAWMPGSWRGCI
jgi:predicted NBD/HSP70 family sugar kinase